MVVPFQALTFFYDTLYEENTFFLVLRKDYSYVNTITTFESKAKNTVDRTTRACAKYIILHE